MELNLEMKRPPLRYHGGKWRLAPWIIEQMPEHNAYVEVFGGGAGVLLRKERSRIEIYNDLEKEVVNFFQVLRDEVLSEHLVKQIGLTPFSRDEFEASYEPSEGSIERARKFVVRCAMGHGTCSMDPKDSNGFRSCDIRAGKSYGREWAGVPASILAAADRFAGVTIENLDFRKLIPKFDNKDTLFYVDPPYPMSTRMSGGQGYVHEMSDHDHEQLHWLLEKCKGKVMLSGYDCRLYDRLYKDWTKTTLKTTANGI